MPKLTIDGQSVEVEAGTTILNAAKKLGIDIPVFCYHEGLSVAANCRMCLVEVKGVAKPVPSCEVQVREGMEVFTQSDFAKEARRSTVEFILLNHPVDCPICDQAGECILQDNYHAHDFKPSRINIRKVRKAKVVTLGPNVVLDRERCINCTRCVRFCREISKTEQLVQVKRGNETEIAVFSGKSFDDPYSLCTVDICPVGALTSTDFRFKQRVWWLKTARSICPECSRGCNFLVDFKDSTIYRTRPAANPAVNQFWACDNGRLAFHRYETQRLLSCRQNSPAGAAEITAEQALEAAAQRVTAGRSGADTLMVIPAFASMEEAYAAVLFAQRILGSAVSFYLGARADGPADKLLRHADRNPNRAGVTKVAAALGIQFLNDAQLSQSLASRSIRQVWTLGDEWDIPTGVALQGVELIAFSSFDSARISAAALAFPIPGHYEKTGSFMNATGVLQAANRIVPLPEGVKSTHVWLAKLARACGGDLGYTDFETLRRSLFDRLGETAPGLSPVASSHA